MTSTLLALLLAASPAGRAFTLDAGSSTLSFRVIHKLHTVDGTVGSLEGKAVVQDDGRVLAMIRAPLASFRTGDGNRDAHMQETLESGKFPFVVFKGTAQLPGNALVAAAQPSTASVTMTGEVELHGRKNAVSVPLTISIAPDGTARAKGTFTIGLDTFGIERPSLLFVKIDDACRIDVDLALKEARP